ncbi:hypothetical protein ACFL67_03755 [candidate division KSB1 bacterium]
MNRLLILLMCVSLFCCGNNSSSGSSDDDVKLSSKLAKILEFGSDNLPEEYLLAMPPMSIEVNDKGDIFIPDEQRIKVYDQNGRPKQIIGGPGQGPGEFPYQVLYPTIGQNGHFTASTGGLSFSVFSPEEFKFVDYIHSRIEPHYIDYARQYSLENYYFTNAAALSNDQFILNADFSWLNMKSLLYVNADSIYEITSHDAPNAGIMSISTTYSGDIYHIIPNSEYLVYINTVTDVKIDRNSSFYMLTKFRFDDYSKSTIQIPYYPAIVPDSIKQHEREILKITNSNTRNQEWKTLVEKGTTELIDNTEFYPPLQKLYYDRGLLFAVTFQKNKRNQFLTQMIDLGKGEIVNKFWLDPIVITTPGRYVKPNPRITGNENQEEVWIPERKTRYLPLKIKNGKAYFVWWGGGTEMPSASVYEINPEVYNFR